MKMNKWRQREFPFLVLYALAFYIIIIHRSLQLSRDHGNELRNLGRGWLADRLNDVSDAQWRNFRGNIPILTVVFGIFTLLANILRKYCHLGAKGMSFAWILISLAYLAYLHGACIIFILLIASVNFLLVKIFARRKYFSFVIWIFNIYFLFANRVYNGYRFSTFGKHAAYLDNFRGTFRWQICFNFVILRMISFGYDYRWAHEDTRFDHKERSVQNDKFSFSIYLAYLVYAPLYIAGPIIGFNAFASQLGTPQRNYSVRYMAWYGFRWAFSLLLMELMTHLFYYNAFAISDLWRQLSPMDIFIIGYGVLNFMWLKFYLIWRYFRFCSLICGIEAPENMPKCINNCYNLEGFWKSWHASYNKWLVRYMYIPLGGSRRKLINVWVIFTFVAIWHDVEWKLLAWAWLTCLFFIPEMILKSATDKFQVESSIGEFIFRELTAVAGAITITFLMVANLVGYVIGPSGTNWLISRFLEKEGLYTLGGMFMTFYVGTKLMIDIREAREMRDKTK